MAKNVKMGGGAARLSILAHNYMTRIDDEVYLRERKREKSSTFVSGIHPRSTKGACSICAARQDKKISMLPFSSIFDFTPILGDKKKFQINDV